MQDVPQFVLKRLQEMRLDTDSHPDADLLTAFAEQSLAGDERSRVMQHLAACRDCRDTVALALPAIEIVASPLSPSTVRIGWLSLPALRWGALAAGVLTVVSVGVLQYSHRTQGSIAASNRTHDAELAPLANQSASLQATVPPGEMQKKMLATPSSQILTAHKSAAEASRADQPRSSPRYAGAIHGSMVAGSGGGMAVGSEAYATDAQISPSLKGQALPTPGNNRGVVVGRNSEVVEVQAGAAPVNTESEVNRNQLAQNLAQNQNDLPLQGRVATNLDVVKAKDPVPAQAGSGAAPAPPLAAPSPLQTSPALMLRASPRWTLSSSGVLQRSFDGGNTWENVNPAQNGSSIGGPMVRDGAAKAGAMARFGDAKQDKVERKLPAESTPNPASVFRALAATGLEVWAGGSGGTLYHTSDGGSRWTRVAPSVAGTALTGDIVGIQFLDPQHGKISTSTAELWTTSDGGQTWQKQP